MCVNRYDELYQREKLYWGATPSKTCDLLKVAYPPDGDATLLVIGCGEGRNALHLARQGYRVSGFDLSPAGVEKTNHLARQEPLSVTAFVADIRDYRLLEGYDILFSTGSLHYLPPDLRAETIANYKSHTRPGGVHLFSVFVEDPEIAPAPDAEQNAHLWTKGELAGYYQDWQIEWSLFEIFDCNSGGVPHRHATDRILARRIH